MKKVLRFLMAGTFIFLSVPENFAQIPTIADCFGAIPVCEDIYFETDSPEGIGNYTDELHPDMCIEDEDNSVWYVFTTTVAGNLGIEIIPNDLDDDYDWAVFDLNAFNCANLKDNFDAYVSCNATGQSDCQGVTGPNGGSIYDFQNLNCGTFPPTFTSNGFVPFNDLIPVNAGDVYVLLIVNFTGSTNGYTLDFTAGDNVGVSDNLRPSFEIITNPEDCGETEFTAVFSENINCSSFDALDLTLTGPGGPYNLSISSDICDQGIPYGSEFTIFVDPPISAAGTFELTINEDPVDACGNPVNASTFAFNIVGNSETATVLDTILCAGNTLLLDGTNSEFTSYQWEGGPASPTLTVDSSASYELLLSIGCETLLEIYNVEFLSISEFNQEQEYLIAYADTLELNLIIPLDVADFFWTGNLTTLSCADCSNPDVFPLATTTYFLHLIGENGCENIIPITVQVKSALEFYAPNIFTPNDDGINDLWTIYGTKQLLNISELVIYDRWGEKVYERSNQTPGDTQSGWDGTFKNNGVSQGVFGWYAVLEFANGEILKESGSIMVMR